MKLLITVQNIAEFRPISSLIPADRITPYIQEAQQFDLKRMLGDPFYVDFMARYDQNADSKYTVYQELLNGKSYLWNGLTYEHPGLIGYLSYMTLARFYNNNQINASKYGLVQKTADNSTPLDWKAIASAVAELRSNALNFQVDIRQFLQANPASYPLFNYQDGSALGQTGVKFFDPDDGKFPGNKTNGRTLISW